MPEGTPAEARKRRKQYELKPQSKLPYAWDLPAENNKQLQVKVGGRERVINVLEIGAQIPCKLRPRLAYEPVFDDVFLVHSAIPDGSTYAGHVD